MRTIQNSLTTVVRWKKIESGCVVKVTYTLILTLQVNMERRKTIESNVTTFIPVNMTKTDSWYVIVIHTSDVDLVKTKIVNLQKQMHF